MKTAPISVEMIGSFGSDLHVVNAARVSFEKESSWDVVDVVEEDGEPCPLYYDFQLKPADVKLVSYLAKHKHFSPFNHCFLSFRVKAPIFVARQLVKHKFMPWNEVSRRYVDSEPEFFESELRKKADNVKQGSSEELMDEMYNQAGEEHTKNLLAFYISLIDGGCAPEVARNYLPHTLMTEWIWSGTLGAFADMLALRLDPHSQKESRDVANLIYEQALPLFPVSLPALLENK